MKEIRGYDTLTRMTNLVYKKWLTTLLSIDYRYDNGDRRTNEVWSTGRNLAYGYDRAHQLTDVMSPSRASDRASYRYDKAGNPIRRTEMGFGVTNSFNNLNQIVSGIWAGGAITVAGAVNYAAGTVIVAGVTGTIYPDRTFDATNVTVTTGTNILTAVYYGPAFTNTQMIATDQVTVVVGNAAYTHDANGNLTSDQNFIYQYDLANRLTNVISKASGSSVLAARYDGLGRRVEVTRNGSSVERYVYFPGSFLVLAVLDGSNQVKEIYTHGPDLSGAVGGAGGIGGILSCRIGTTNRWLHADAMGNIVLATDEQGKEVGQYRYSPFGRPLNQTGAFTPRFQYSSKEWNEPAGMYYYGYRWYDPQAGRWLSRDPLGEEGGLHLYIHAGNNPVNFMDPLGLLRWTGNCMGFGVGLSFIGGSYYDCDLWSECFEKDDGCCYKQWVKTRVAIISIGLSIGIDLFGKGSISGSQGAAIFDAPKEDEWKAFSGSVELEKALDLNVLGRGGAVYSSFWLGKAKYNSGLARIYGQQGIATGISLTGFIKSIGWSYAKLKKEYECDCSDGR